MFMCSMRELVILAALVSALYAASLPLGSDEPYTCKEDQDKTATHAAVQFINDHHRHGYKFKFVSQDSRTADEKAQPCELVLRMTLEETNCHIVNPKPLDQCEARTEAETKVTAKCNVTISSAEGKAAVKRYICDTEPASPETLVAKCPDCPSLLPLHDPQGLESVKAALQKFNKESNHASYFKLLEVGRITTQWMFSGQSYFAEFAIVETDCPNKDTTKKQDECKSLCPDQARYGFCKSTKFGDKEPTMDCEIYEVQNSTKHIHHAKESRKDCKFHGSPHHHPHHHHHHHHHHAGHHIKPARTEHASHDHRDKTPDQRGRPEHASHPTKDKIPDHRGRPEHTGHPTKDKLPDHRDRPEHPGHSHKNKTKDHKEHPGHAHHSDKDAPRCPKGPSGFPGPETEGRHEFPCHGFVKIPPSIYPICPFPPARACRGPPDLVPPVTQQ